MAATIKRKYGKDAKSLGKTPNQSFKVYSITGDSSYPTGGYEVAIDEAIIAMVPISPSAYVWSYNPATKKVLAYKADDKIETAGDGKLIQETNGTNMASITVDWLVFTDEI